MKNDNVRTVYWYIDLLEKLQQIRKDNPNDASLGSKIRQELKSLEDNAKTS